MNHNKEYVIRLNGLDIGQVIDGLEVRADAWRMTANYLKTGEAPEGFVIEECDDAEEARKLEGHYRRIIGTLMEQMEGQR